MLHIRLAVKISEYCAKHGHTHLLAHNLERSAKAIGKAAARHRTAGILTMAQCRAALAGSSRARGFSQPTLRRHLSMLREAGVVHVNVARDEVRIASFFGRVGDAKPDIIVAREGKLFSLADAKKLDAAKAYAAPPCMYKPPKGGPPAAPQAPVDPPPAPSFDPKDTSPATALDPERLRSQTCASPSPAAPICTTPPAPVDAAPPVICERKRSSKAVSDEDLDAIADLPLPKAKDEFAAWAERMQKQQLADEAASADVAQTLHAKRECPPTDGAGKVAKLTTDPPTKQPKKAGREIRPAIEGRAPATRDEVRRMLRRRGDIPGLVVASVLSLGAPLCVLEDALSRTQDAVRAPRRRHGRVSDPPAFFMGTVRRVVLERRGGSRGAAAP